MSNTKYTPQQVADLINSDEPTFIIRAKDNLAMSILLDYIREYAATKKETVEGMKALGETVVAFAKWRAANKDKVKMPTP